MIKKLNLNSGQMENGREGGEKNVQRVSGGKYHNVQWIWDGKKFENQMTKEWTENWIFMSSAHKKAEKDWMWSMKSFFFIYLINDHPKTPPRICY